MKPHKHAELIKLWADGYEIECRNKNFQDTWSPIKACWDLEFLEFRIKSKPNPKHEIGYMYLNWQDGQNEWFITAAPFKCTKFKFKVETL